MVKEAVTKENVEEKDTYKGICAFCQGEFDKARMTQHLKNCKERQAKNAAQTGAPRSRKAGAQRLFHLVVEGDYLPMYWMHLEMPASETLDDLDAFLRGIWLECCGHLSAFQIGKMSYLSQTEEDMFDLLAMLAARYQVRKTRMKTRMKTWKMTNWMMSWMNWQICQWMK